MEDKQFLQILVFALIVGIVLIAMSCLGKGLVLEEGECWDVNNETQVCAKNCTDIDEDACEGFIENRTKELESNCLGFKNISMQINNTFSKISGNFLDDCNKWKNGSEKWKDAYEICDERLHQLNVDTVDEMNASLEQCQSQYRSKRDELSDMEERYEQANTNMITGTFLALIAGAFAMWFFKVRKRSGQAEVDFEGTVPSETI